MSLDVEQHIILKSEYTLKTFDIIETSLSRNNLGFRGENKEKNMYRADDLWDLRIENKVYLYLTNLSDEPFGVLYFNNYSQNYFKFQEPIKLEQLDIEFRDSDNELYNFHNLTHSLSFGFETLN